MRGGRLLPLRLQHSLFHLDGLHEVGSVVAQLLESQAMGDTFPRAEVVRVYHLVRWCRHAQPARVAAHLERASFLREDGTLGECDLIAR